MNLGHVPSPRIVRPKPSRLVNCAPIGSFSIGAGARGIKLPGGGGGAGGSGNNYPSTLALTGWWRASYSGPPWSGTASAGTSGSNNLTDSGNSPSAGTAVNGYTPADFDGLNDVLNGPNVDDLVSNSAGTIIALAYMDAAFADPGASLYYTAPAFFGRGVSNSRVALCYTSSGVRIGGSSDGISYDSVAVAASTGAWHLLQGRWNGTTLEVRVDSGSWSTLAQTITLTTTGMVSGSDSSGTNYLNGKVLELMTAQIRVSDSEANNIVSYVNDRYALSF